MTAARAPAGAQFWEADLRYFALACDYDGTLALNGRVDGETIAALEQVVASGRRLVMVTGRELDNLLEVFDRPDVFEWIVAENGALLYSPAGKQERALAEPIAPEFAAELRRRGVAPLRSGRIIVATWEPHEMTVLDTIRDFGLELQVIFNKGAVMVLPAGVNKATGLAAALAEMGLSPHNVAGVGDAENDHAFLSLCEFSAAVQNALPLVKERSDLVTKADHGAGVRELAAEMVRDDLESLARTTDRHRIAVGKSVDGADISLRPFGPNILLSGTSGAGKSTLAKVFLERLADQGYQFCIIDPEGDYEDFEVGIVLGNEQRAPTVAEVAQLLQKPGQNAVVNLLGLDLDDRRAFFTRLMTGLLEMRGRSGRPHWIVVDEAHHLMPVGWEPASVALPQELYGMLLITVHPEILSPKALNLIGTVAVVGETPAEMIRSFAAATGEKAPPVAAEALPSGEALVWSREGGRKVERFQIGQTRLQHQRHRRKYAEGDLGENSFYFRGAEGNLNLKAQNLFLFLQIADGVDDETWEHHRRRRDYSRWIRKAVKNDELAAEVAAIEKSRIDARESRSSVRTAIEKYYTLPAPHKPAPEAPLPSEKAREASSRRKAAEKTKAGHTRR